MWTALRLAGVLIGLGSVLSQTVEVESGSWTQWGGPDRDFSVQVPLPSRWAPGDLEPVWTRPLEGGHSGIVSDGHRLYTAHGEARVETVTAFDAKTGSALWEVRSAVGFASHMKEYDGPHATPLLMDDRLYTVSIDARVRAFDAGSGVVLWSRDLVAEEGVRLPQSGYAASPVAWGDRLLLPGLGGPGPGALALGLRDGRTIWARHDFRSSHASPLVIEFAGAPLAVFHGMDDLVGLHPGDGAMVFRHSLRRGAADNVSFSPIWDAERNQLLLSHGFDREGAQAVRLTLREGEITAARVWNNHRMRVQHGNGVVLDGVFYASSGPGPAFLTALDAASGKLLWRRRGFGKSNLLAAGDQLVILDEKGELGIAKPSRSGLEVLARARLLDDNAWTVPTLVTPNLYLRDRNRMVAIELLRD